MKTALVGLSGGVDSAVAALLLKRQGYGVAGATMSIWDESMPTPPDGGRACVGPEEKDIATAKAVADFLQIPFSVIDCVPQFKAFVLENFRQEYKEGRTPNPCVWCNSLVKFTALPQAAKAMGVSFDIFATGHYAQTNFDQQSNRRQLKKAIDPQKDQTYFLYRLTQEQLAYIRFPLGGYTKEQVRQIAAQ
ncbi:MAG: tRNA 2-thiouridine(34) synthase MnmA, partial [Elusimicrobiota bacterium]|nr:tRNA 2-thiouridine(34) synthase MnmA [Elusimicrobiota bacterium]